MPNLVRALLPWGAAALLFRPRRRLAPEDPVISLLGRVRAIVGLVLVLVIAVWFRSYSNLDLENYLQGLAACTGCACAAAPGRQVARPRLDGRRAPPTEPGDLPHPCRIPR